MTAPPAGPAPDPAEEIPGTIVFDGRRSRAGLPLNNLAMTLNKKAERDSFVADPEAFMERFGLSDEQRDAVRQRDFLRMIELGGNIYFIYKIGMVDGLRVPDIVASMAGQTTEEFVEMMRNGGRDPRG
ncbi:protocatechuate 3,4-dioxygenase [Pseudonocardia sp. GCM10023141]|uniref:protocatechuate 3,4-dioxygenase n=1 Tax=Pseudonocardia sp. GCM10023141 TaxID=3252653 RepID=UPI003607F54D